MNRTSENAASMVISYLALRRAIGILAMLLPFVLSLGAIALFDETAIQDSISHYYHTGMRDVFVGTLCVIGFFLLSYRGYGRLDDVAGDLGCVFAVGVALFPTTADGTVAANAHMIGRVHFASAALLFTTLIYFSLFSFTQTNPTTPPTTRKLQRNKVYIACGCAMVLCMLLIAVYLQFPKTLTPLLGAYRPVYWLEALAVLAFGISWFVKGETILTDRK